jgi:hypothetical protein
MRPFVKTPSPLHFDKVFGQDDGRRRVLVSFAPEMHVRCRRDGEMIRESVGNISRPVDQFHVPDCNIDLLPI